MLSESLCWRQNGQTQIQKLIPKNLLHLYTASFVNKVTSSYGELPTFSSNVKLAPLFIDMEYRFREILIETKKNDLSNIREHALFLSN